MALDLGLDRLLTDATVLATVERHDELNALRNGWAKRLTYEKALAKLYDGVEQWTMPGYCAPCRSAQLLLCDWTSAWGGTPNFRERMHCPRCRLNSRQRFMTQLVETLGAPPYYLYDLVTPLYDWAHRTLDQVVGSEYLGPDVPGGTIIDNLRHEDALNLSFDDNAFGTIVSSDVFEHVPDIDQALRECVRVLRPGGTLVLSTPFDPDQPDTVQRSVMHDGGEIELLLDPVYHGNPIDREKGSLVFFDFGWDLVDRMRAAGFRDAGAVAYWSHYNGYLGRGLQFMLVGRA